MRERAGWVVAALLAATVLTSAQGWSMTGWFQQTIAVQQARLNLIQQSAGDPMLRGYLDGVWQDSSTGESRLHLVGWAFQCVGSIGFRDVYKVDLRLNGFRKDVTEYMTRTFRPDVPLNAGLAGWCPVHIPDDTGVYIDAPIGQLLPGWYSIRLDFWTTDGRSLTTPEIWMQVQ